MSHILAINAGSTTVKYKLFSSSLEEILFGHIENDKGVFESKIIKNGQKYKWEITEAEFKNPVKIIAKEIEGYDISKAGFRIVHGGEKYKKTTKLTEKTLKDLEELSQLAPLHNPPALKVIHQFQKHFPSVEMFGVFDTSFHTSMKPEQFLYSLPYELYSKYHIRKYGFHGISHEYLYQEITKLEKKHNKVITCHLGGGASITAILKGKSYDTTMGFTPLEGLTMATRAGDVDLGVIFYLADNHYLEIKDIKHLMNSSSGLLGISGKTSDMRTLLDLEKKGDERARLAIEIYIYDIVRYIGSYIAALDGIDVLVFSGGVGAGSDILRARICERLLNFKVKLAKSRNNGKINVSENLKISNRGSVPVWVIPTDEEKMIAEKTVNGER